ncbi:MAG: IS1380 family transposase [Dermatophilus congolensis]|nr:IS1380 family transposase [Dermatophilus congolensis]
MKKRSGFYPVLRVGAAGVNAVGNAGGVLLTSTVRASGLDSALSAALEPWRPSNSVHDPGKVLLDLAITLVLGGDACSDTGLLRAEPGVYGPVASNPTISRTIAALAADAGRVEAAVAAARRAARAHVWSRAGEHAPDLGLDAGSPLVIDIDATLVTAHSEKENAAATFKRGFGFHPLCAFVDHGPDGTGEPLAMLLRPGNAGSNTAADHITVARQAMKALPGVNAYRPGKKVLFRTDGAGCSHAFVEWLHARGVQYSVGYTLPDTMPDLYKLIPADAWAPAVNSAEDPREGADVAEITGMLDLASWPDGMRIIVRRERPHPGAQLRFDDVQGYRLTAFATNTRRGQLAHLELRHRRRARCEDRIRIAKDTGLTNLPLKHFAANRIWLLIVQLAADLLAWQALLGFAGHEAACWEPKRLRVRLYSIPATLAHTARQVHLRVKDTAPWADLLISAYQRLAAVPVAPG